ncbi:MAG TPA: sugar transferase [Lachnospiraceae bacterium]|nr:sugar transferase [Lachnospiraceae bacterium]
MKTKRDQLIIEHLLLSFSDLLCVVIAYAAAVVTRGITGSVREKPAFYLLVLLFALILSVLSHIFLDLDTGFAARSMMAEFFFVCKYDLFLGATMGMILFLTQKAQDFSRLAYIYFLIYQLILCFIFHLIIKHLITQTYMRSGKSGKMVVYTPAGDAEKVLSSLKTAKAWPHEIVDAVSKEEELYEKIGHSVVDEVFISYPGLKQEELSSIVDDLELSGITVHVAIDPVSHISDRAMTGEIGDIPVLTYRGAGEDLHRLIIKRFTDIAGSLIGMIITVVLFPFIAVLIKLDSPGPVLYKQVRIGRNGREFKLCKFRSMYKDAESRQEELSDMNVMNGPVFKVKDDPRITKFGRFLRKTSLDELPQFFHVFAGTMSLIGTRPPTKEEYSSYHLSELRRVSIKPGMTGLWQVSGRNEITDFKDILRLDLKYIDNWSFGMDIKILLETIAVVFRGNGM